jgi:hypothetical protein
MSWLLRAADAARALLVPSVAAVVGLRAGERSAPFRCQHLPAAPACHLLGSCSEADAPPGLPGCCPPVHRRPVSPQRCSRCLQGGEQHHCYGNLSTAPARLGADLSAGQTRTTTPCLGQGGGQGLTCIHVQGLDIWPAILRLLRGDHWDGQVAHPQVNEHLCGERGGKGSGAQIMRPPPGQ